VRPLILHNILWLTLLLELLASLQLVYEDEGNNKKQSGQYTVPVVKQDNDRTYPRQEYYRLFW
jgi:hypothetical protein